MKASYLLIVAALIVAALLALAGPAHAEDEIPGMDEYAWQFPVQVQDSAEYFEAQIPLSVYRSVTDPQLRDLGIYDANGRAVPRIAQHRDDQGENVEVRQPLGFIPLYDEPEQNSERLRLLMESNDSGTRFEFDTASSDASAPAASLQSYVVDLRGLNDTRFAELEFDWPETPTGFIGGVSVAQSNDLASWQPVASGTLADLEFEDTRIQRNRISINPGLQDFLRITWHEMPAGWQLSTLTGIRKERGPDLLRNWATMPPVERHENEREFIFDIGGYPPIDRIGLELGGQNVVVRAVFEFRGTPESAWRQAHQGLFYTIGTDGNRISSEPVRLGKTRAGEWRVRILSGRVDGNVQLKLGWLPGRLLFLSQGQPPYTLATGRAQDAVENYPQHRLLGDSSLFSMLIDTTQPGVANIGLRANAAGATALDTARTWTWRTVLVWIGLFAAVGFVGFLVWSLMKENKKEQGAN